MAENTGAAQARELLGALYEHVAEISQKIDIASRNKVASLNCLKLRSGASRASVTSAVKVDCVDGDDRDQHAGEKSPQCPVG
jgi:hypothetical protein